MKYTKLNANLEIKSFDDETGTFDGYLSTFHNIDSQKDEVQPGAFKKTINDAEQKSAIDKNPVLFPILYQHEPNEPIGGFVEMREDDKGLWVKGFLDLDIEQGRRAYSGMKRGYLRKMSIGYRTVKADMQKGTNVRLLKEIQLYEGSIVTFPANDQASVDNVKEDTTMCTKCEELQTKLASMELELSLYKQTKAGRAISANNHAVLSSHCDNAMTGMDNAMESMKSLKGTLDQLGMSDAGEQEVSDTDDQRQQPTNSAKPGKSEQPNKNTDSDLTLDGIAAELRARVSATKSSLYDDILKQIKGSMSK